MSVTYKIEDKDVIQVDAAKRHADGTSQDMVRLTYAGSGFRTSHDVTIDEAERLHYKLKWVLQQLGRARLDPKLYVVKVRVFGNWTGVKYAPDKIHTLYVVVNREDEVEARVRALMGSHGRGVRVEEKREAQLSGTVERVAVVTEKEGPEPVAAKPVAEGSAPRPIKGTKK